MSCREEHSRTGRAYRDTARQHQRPGQATSEHVPAEDFASWHPGAPLRYPTHDRVVGEMRADVTGDNRAEDRRTERAAQVKRAALQPSSHARVPLRRTSHDGCGGTDIDHAEPNTEHGQPAGDQHATAFGVYCGQREHADCGGTQPADYRIANAIRVDEVPGHAGHDREQHRQR